jgi:hypothetical protein
LDLARSGSPLKKASSKYSPTSSAPRRKVAAILALIQAAASSTRSLSTHSSSVPRDRRRELSERPDSAAVAQELSFRELRQVVAEEMARKETPELKGRRGLPRIIKALKASLRLLRTSDGKSAYSAVDIRKLDEWQKKDANAFSEELLAELKDLISKLH